MLTLLTTNQDMTGRICSTLYDHKFKKNLESVYAQKNGTKEVELVQKVDVSSPEGRCET